MPGKLPMIERSKAQSSKTSQAPPDTLQQPIFATRSFAFSCPPPIALQFFNFTP
jgi:hypothetical protein